MSEENQSSILTDTQQTIETLTKEVVVENDNEHEIDENGLLLLTMEIIVKQLRMENKPTQKKSWNLMMMNLSLIRTIHMRSKWRMSKEKKNA